MTGKCRRLVCGRFGSKSGTIVSGGPDRAYLHLLPKGVRRHVRDFLQARLWIVGVWHSLRHVHQTSSRRDADASKQVGEPGIGANGVPERVYFEVSETIEPLLVSLF